MRLPPFHKASTCAKCGSRTLTLRWCTSTHSAIYPNREHCPIEATPPVKPIEHMHHTCKTCSYQWVTRTLHARPSFSF